MYRTMGLNKAEEHGSRLKAQGAGKNLSFSSAVTMCLQ